MFQNSDEVYLKRLIGRNEVLLFLGSGFSLMAKNRFDDNFPTGWQLGEMLWNFMKLDGPYDNTPLQEMYQAFLNSPIKKNLKEEFIFNTLMAKNIPPIYSNVTKFYWYKIYTLNIDDILIKIYQSNNKPVQILKYPNDEYKERDQSLEHTQIVYLHGKLPCDLNEIVFATKQYAKSSLIHQPLYGQFVYDYATKPSIFLGTDLNEPIFEKYIESREGKSGYAELRPKSFLIAPSLSPVKAANLKSLYNVHYVKGTTEDFLNWLTSIQHELPNRTEILKNTFPSLIDLTEYVNLSNVERKAVSDFAGAFKRVPTDYIPRDGRSGYLEGSSPRWNDIFSDLDIPRTITNEIFDYTIERVNDDKDQINIIGLSGTAGSGKSTILKRLGLRLSQDGRTVFLSYSDYMPKVDYVIDVLKSINQRVVLIFDNAKNIINQLPTLIKRLCELKFVPIVIVALRRNHLDYIDSCLNASTRFKAFVVPDLDETEIKSLIAKLDENNLLGRLKGLSDKQRILEFKYKSKKQILIAMKEATSGVNFDKIIKTEFDGISPQEAKQLCLCIALNTELGYTNSKQDFVGFSDLAPAVSLNYLSSNLAGTIMWVGPLQDKFMLRHRVLADYMIKFCVDSEMLRNAYIKVLSVLAPELKRSNGASRKITLFKLLINHQNLYVRFKKDINEARLVYESISDFFNNDSQYWLQYGSLEIEGVGGDLNRAENFLHQAQSLDPNNPLVKNAICDLYFRKAYQANTLNEAFELKDYAENLAKALVLQIGRDDPHIFHIYCRGLYDYQRRWIVDRHEKKQIIISLQRIIQNAISYHPYNKRIDSIAQAINRAYLHLGLDTIINDPELPGY